MKGIIILILTISCLNALADERKTALCDSLKEKRAIFDSYGLPMRQYAYDFNQSLGRFAGTDVFEHIQFLAQCKNQELELDQSVKYSAYANVMEFRSSTDIEESFQFYQSEYLKLLDYITQYPLMTKVDRDTLLSFKQDLPILIESLNKLAVELGAFDYSALIKNETGSIQERNSKNKIVVDCREQVDGNCREIWYILEQDNKNTVLNRMVLTEHKLFKKLMKHDKEYFKATETFALYIYAAVASELIPFAPIILPIAIPGVVISATIEGLRYPLARKNHMITYRSTVKNADTVVGKGKFNKMIKYLKQIQFHPFKP